MSAHYLAALLLLAQLAGHAGGGNRANRSFGKYNVLCVGDSITAGTVVTTSYPENLRSIASSSATWNAGIGGDQTTGMVQRWQKQFRGAKWDAVVVLGGVNDAIADVSAATIFANLQTIYDQAHADGLKVVAITMTPWDGFSVWNSSRQTITTAVNTSIRNYVTANPSNTVLVDAYVIFADGVDPAKISATYDNGDHLHPNQTGSNLIASSVKTALGL